MKKRTIHSKKALFVVLSILTILSSQAIGAEVYQVDPVHSSVIFRIKHLGITFVYGRFNDPFGTFVVDEVTPDKSSVEISVQTRNVDTFNQQRDAHLQSPDFFNAEQFKDITFKGRSFQRLDEETALVTGDLTLHGVTRQLSIIVKYTGSAKDPWGGYRIGFETSFSVKRSDYGMRFMLGDVGDEVQITVSIQGIRK